MKKVLFLLFAWVLLSAQMPMIPGFPPGTFQNRAAIDAPMPPSSGMRTPIMADNGQTGPSTTSTQYMGVNGSATPWSASVTNRDQPWAKSGTWKNLVVRFPVALTQGTFDITLMVNGFATALTCQITTASTTCSDPTNTAYSNPFPTSSNQWELCNSFSHLACFGSLIEDFQIFNVIATNGSSGRSVVYTNNAQHEAGMRRMAIYPGGCGRGATYETGYGGATYILLDSVEFKGGKSDANCGGAAGAQMFINFGSVQVIVDNLNVSGYAAGIGGPRTNGLSINGGFVDIRGFHSEQVVNPATINIAGGVANGMVRARNAIGGVDCVGLFLLPNGNTFGNFMISPPMAQNGCTHMVVNNMAGGAGNMTAATATDVVFLSGTNKAW